MQAAVCRKYGEVEIATVDKPAPNDHEVLIRIRAASVNPFDLHLFSGTPRIGRLFLGLSKPKDWHVGRDVAGVVEAAGAKVTRFKAGDEVFGVCRGSFAEYACTTEARLAMKPENVSFEQAGTIGIAATTALQGLRDKGHLRAGQRVLINGAAGGVGTFAVQIAKAFGAAVTAVGSTAKLEMLRRIGAERVIDYTRDDFTTHAERYDVIFDMIGNHAFSEMKRVLTPDGIIVCAGAKRIGRWFVRLLPAMLFSKRVTMISAKIVREDLDRLGKLMEQGKIAPVIDRTYALADTAKAMARLEEGHASGKIVITMSS